MGWWLQSCFSVLITILLCTQNAETTCDYFQGSWVEDTSYPLYNLSTCPFIDREFGCQRNGRPDQLYLKYRWQPNGCGLSRFDAEDFLTRLKGKNILFVGDSLSRNQFRSLSCMLHSALPNAKYNITRVNDDVSSITFTDFDVKLVLDHKVFLVDVVEEKIGRVLRLDSIEGGKLWKGYDMLIFNTWHWWNRRGPKQPWDYVEVGNKTYKDMDRMAAFETALSTWAGWVDSNIDPNQSRVFFQGISPTHYNGTEWDEPSAGNCEGQTQPVLGSTKPGVTLPAVTVLKRVLSHTTKPVTLLDITNLSLLRKDGHPSVYGLEGQKGMDCTHWCLAGVPDSWNEILYNLIL